MKRDGSRSGWPEKRFSARVCVIGDALWRRGIRMGREDDR